MNAGQLPLGSFKNVVIIMFDLILAIKMKFAIYSISVLEGLKIKDILLRLAVM